ncbi:hypothetical protein ES703_106446 [subsurface metagenome]
MVLFCEIFFLFGLKFFVYQKRDRREGEVSGEYSQGGFEGGCPCMFEMIDLSFRENARPVNSFEIVFVFFHPFKRKISCAFPFEVLPILGTLERGCLPDELFDCS